MTRQMDLAMVDIEPQLSGEIILKEQESEVEVHETPEHSESGSDDERQRQ